MEQFQIREMRETDIAQVEAIEQEIFSVPWSEKSFLSACTTPENIYLVCLAGEEVAGYCGLWSVLGEGNITNMAVAEKYRRNGVAEALMKEMEERGRQKRRDDIFFLKCVKAMMQRAGSMKKWDMNKSVSVKILEKPAENAIIMSKGWRTA